jgi:hypothetical protein
MNGSERLRIVAEKHEKRTFLRHFWAQKSLEALCIGIQDTILHNNA